jgi:uncharacterized protein YbjT (DUF2867 family)
MILITGASGSAGGAVLQAALGNGLPVRAMYRKSAEAARAPAGVAAVVADFSEPASLEPALAGIDSVFLVCGPVPELIELESNMVDECKRAGVRHIVLQSAFGAGDFRESFPSWHFEVEGKLRSSGLAYSILRPNGFQQNVVTYLAPSIRKESAFYAAIGEAKISLVDVRDVGEVAAKILAEPEAHRGKVYELHGPEAVSNYDIASRISQLVGREVRYLPLTEEVMRNSMLGLGMPEAFVNAELALESYYRSGRCAVVDGLVGKLIGRPERTLDHYLRENVRAFQSQAAAV